MKANFRFSRQTNPGTKDSPWIGAEIGFESEVDEALDEAALTQLTDELLDNAKILAFEATNQEYVLDEELGVKPIIEIKEVPKAQYTPRKPPVDTAGLPTITVDGVTYYDYRQKKIDGPEKGGVKPNFPDFKSTDGKDSHWLKNQDGTDSAFKATLAAAGVE